MGYDVSFHPISPEEMREWYFTPLTWVQLGQEEKVLALAAQHGIEDFYAEKYLNTLQVGAGTEPDELFDKSHGFYIAVVQGFFRDYYYTRGSGFSFLLEEKPETIDAFMSNHQMLSRYRTRFMKCRQNGDYLVIWKTGCTGIRSGDMMLLEAEKAVR